LDVLQKGLQDSNPEKRRVTAAALGGTALNPKAIQLLFDTMANDKDPEVRQAAAASFGEMKARIAIPKLKATIENDPQVSFMAARSLWLMGDETGRDLIEEVATGQQKKPGKVSQAKLEASRRLHDPNGLAKTGAMEAASALLGPFSIGLRVATELQKDAGAQSRLLAINMLTQQCDANSIAAIETAFTDDKNEIVRAGAAKAIGVCVGKDAVKKLSDAVLSEKFSVQINAAASLIRISSKVRTPASLQKK
jgi:HEAT repeat protein